MSYFLDFVTVGRVLVVLLVFLGLVLSVVE
jgi:hypothetical protein